jgi:uncharacterized membrane protein
VNLSLMLQLTAFFLVASAIGWCVDTTLRSVRRKRFAPIRKVPFSPLYGIGALLVWAAPPAVAGASGGMQFLAFAVFICAFEYVAGALILKLRGRRIWDYTNRHLNLHGHTDVFHFFLWGTLGLVSYRWVLPALASFIGLKGKLN